MMWLTRTSSKTSSCKESECTGNVNSFMIFKKCDSSEADKTEISLCVCVKDAVILTLEECEKSL